MPPNDPDAWLAVEGWMSEAEGFQLKALADGRRVLEVGSYKGRSTCCMASVALEVVAVDHHKGDDSAGDGGTLDEFCGNLVRCGVADRVKVVCQDFRSFDPHPYGGFDLVYLDADHSAQATYEAAALALSCVRPGGVIAWHDCHYPTVVRGMEAAGLAWAHKVDSLGWTEVE